MPTLLNIQSSPRGGQSISRTLSHDFVEAWQAKHPDGKVVVRDLAEGEFAVCWGAVDHGNFS